MILDLSTRKFPIYFPAPLGLGLTWRAAHVVNPGGVATAIGGLREVSLEAKVDQDLMTRLMILRAQQDQLDKIKQIALACEARELAELEELLVLMDD